MTDWPLRNRRLVWRNGELVTIDTGLCQHVNITSDGTCPTWFGIDPASGPDRHVVMERDAEGRWHELTPSEAERAMIEARRRDREEFNASCGVKR